MQNRIFLAGDDTKEIASLTDDLLLKVYRQLGASSTEINFGR